MASTHARRVLLWRVAIGSGFLPSGSGATTCGRSRRSCLVPDFLDPYFVSKPSEIWKSFLRLGCLTDRAAVRSIGWSGMHRRALPRMQ